tara:strand:+ start:405 stop:554 length:150 start_codon:yes stop_codon:yes gene_type:complete
MSTTIFFGVVGYKKYVQIFLPSWKASAFFTPEELPLNIDKAFIVSSDLG